MSLVREVKGGQCSSGGGAPGDTPRLLDRLDARLVNVLTAVGLGAPVVAYFWLIGHFGVNVIYQDQWSDVAVIQKWYAHGFDWSSLWAQHNENRILFPNLIVVFLAHTTHLDIRVEEYLSGLMLVAATFLVIWAHKRRSPATPWLYYCPVVVMTCSFVQYGATLWGFQLAWYLVLLGLAGVVVLIDRINLNWISFTAAAAAAVVASFSSLQGLLVWAIGLVLLLWRRRRVRFLVVWTAAAIVSAGLYLYNFNMKAGTIFPSSLTRHSVSPVLFGTFVVGDVVGVPIKLGGSNGAIFALGVLIVLLAIATLTFYGLHADAHGPGVVGMALVLFGLLFAALVARGRAPWGTGRQAPRDTPSTTS